jgi:hypothetical protein
VRARAVRAEPVGSASRSLWETAGTRACATAMEESTALAPRSGHPPNSVRKVAAVWRTSNGRALAAWPHPARLDGAVGLGRRDRTSQRLLFASISAAVLCVALGSSRFALPHADAVEQSALPTAEDAIEHVSLSCTPTALGATLSNTQQKAVPYSNLRWSFPPGPALRARERPYTTPTPLGTSGERTLAVMSDGIRRRVGYHAVGDTMPGLMSDVGKITIYGSLKTYGRSPPRCVPIANVASLTTPASSRVGGWTLAGTGCCRVRLPS